MKNTAVTIFCISLLASSHSYAEDAYDITCTLESGDVMTLSHSKDTAYVAFLGPNDDPDEGGSVIKLDIPSGGAEQFLDNSNENKRFFVLRGTDDDIEGAVAVGYEDNNGKLNAYFSSMNSLGKEVARHTCKPQTIRASQTLLTAGIGITAPSQKKQPGYTDNNATNTNTDSPFKISVSEELFQYGSIKTPYRTVNIVSTSDDLVINGVTVNRNQCSESVGNPKKAFKLPFGKTITYKYNIQSRRCDVVEIIVKTNNNNWTFRP